VLIRHHPQVTLGVGVTVALIVLALQILIFNARRWFHFSDTRRRMDGVLRF
jgi:hypothetical protein